MKEKEMLIGKIVSKAGATGDTELISLIGKLLSELSSESKTEVHRTTSDVKYIVCIEATMKNGKKVFHPIVGGCMNVPRSVPNKKMVIGDDLVQLQRDTHSMKNSIEKKFSLKVVYVPVSDKSISALENKLKKFFRDVEKLGKDIAKKKKEAYAFMNVEISTKGIDKTIASDMMKNTVFAGGCLSDEGKVIDRPKEQYIEEKKILKN